MVYKNKYPMQLLVVGPCEGQSSVLSMGSAIPSQEE